MFPGLELMTCPNLAVAPEVMRHVVSVESSHNPYAIGVVNGQLQRQPQNLDEAIATAKMLEAEGYNYSLGVAQINRNNLARYGLDTYEKAFDACLNVAAGSRILAECYASAGQNWGKAFSCYYSGNFSTGFRDGYVQKIYESIGRGMQLAQVSPIPLAKAVPSTIGPAMTQQIVLKDAPAYRIALRSKTLDTVANAAISTLPQPVSPTEASPATPLPAQQTSPDIFVPIVHGPSDSATETSANSHSVAVADTTSSSTIKSATDSGELPPAGKDDAFVF
jgi:type IV secretion system protein VirB1